MQENQRTGAFDSTKGSLLDRFIWMLRVRQMKRSLPVPIDTVVDLGCGRTAPLLQQLLDHRLVQHAIGVDLAPDMHAQSERLTLVQANLNEPLPLRDAQANVVLSLAVLEHLTNPDLHLREARRILKPGGTLLLTTPSPRGKPVLEFLAFTLGVISREEIEDHKQYFNTNMLRESLKRAGFPASTIDARRFQFGMNNIVVVRT